MHGAIFATVNWKEIGHFMVKLFLQFTAAKYAIDLFLNDHLNFIVFLKLFVLKSVSTSRDASQCWVLATVVGLQSSVVLNLESRVMLIPEKVKMLIGSHVSMSAIKNISMELWLSHRPGQFEITSASAAST